METAPFSRASMALPHASNTFGMSPGAKVEVRISYTLIPHSPARGTGGAPGSCLLVQERREQETLIRDDLDVEGDRGERELPSHRGESDRGHFEEHNVRHRLGIDRYRRRRERLTPHLGRGPGPVDRGAVEHPCEEEVALVGHGDGLNGMRPDEAPVVPENP
jgi:hypothetical protein